MGKRKLLSVIVTSMVIGSFFTNIFLFSSLIIYSKANPGDISESWDNSTTLNVTVFHLQPRINWYDFQFNQSGTWVSRLNEQIDVNNSAEYRFCVNISSDQGWDDIEYINITAWHDAGSETSTYNQTLGGNLNMFLQYENITGTANFSILWPDDEVTIGEMIESNETDTDGVSGYTECHNLTFSFIPNYQIRYAPGDGSWQDGPGYNDTWSWNFNITAEDQSGYKSYENPMVGETVDEFGVYSYTEIISVGWPSIVGNPGQTAIATSNITLESRSNGNYSLSVNLSQLDHASNPTANMANTTVSLRGGNLTSITAFPGTGPLYLWGTSEPSFQWAENNSNIKITNDIEYMITIPLSQLPGDYTGNLYYHLQTETG